MSFCTLSYSCRKQYFFYGLIAADLLALEAGLEHGFHALTVELSAAFLWCDGTLYSAIRTPRDLAVYMTINILHEKAHFTLVTNSNKNC